MHRRKQWIYSTLKNCERGSSDAYIDLHAVYQFLPIFTMEILPTCRICAVCVHCSFINKRTCGVFVRYSRNSTSPVRDMETTVLWIIGFFYILSLPVVSINYIKIIISVLIQNLCFHDGWFIHYFIVRVNFFLFKDRSATSMSFDKVYITHMSLKSDRDIKNKKLIIVTIKIHPRYRRWSLRILCA